MTRILVATLVAVTTLQAQVAADPLFATLRASPAFQQLVAP